MCVVQKKVNEEEADGGDNRIAQANPPSVRSTYRHHQITCNSHVPATYHIVTIYYYKVPS